jgi:DNA-binding NarL/FixJ family response regulator
MSPEHATTLVLADDHAIVREGFAALCEANGLRVLGQAADGAAALEMIRREKPDFALLDMQMPGLTGAEVIRRLRAENYTAKLMILSISRDHASVMDALRAGADAYLLKDGPGRHLLDAMQFVRDGGIYISPLLRGAGAISRTVQPRDAMALLSPRETEVFLLLVSGIRAKDIARRLEISPKTVDTFRASLMRKLGVHDLVGLVKFAIERNLTTVSAAG